jgi:3-oxoadipate enol-lactonase
LEKLAVPTLVMAAEKDINAPAKGVEKMAAKIPGAEFICLPGLGHLASLEAPEIFNFAVMDFLNRLKI